MATEYIISRVDIESDTVDPDYLAGFSWEDGPEWTDDRELAKTFDNNRVFILEYHITWFDAAGIEHEVSEI